MKLFIILSLTLATAWAGETWDKTKKQINEAAEGTDRVTRETIQKGKNKWSEHEAKQKAKQEQEERKEYERLKKKYKD